MEADERQRVRAFLREAGAQGVAVEGWGEECRATGKKPSTELLVRLREEKAGILALFTWLAANAPTRHGMVSAPDVYPWELRIDWKDGLPVWFGARERAEAPRYVCWASVRPGVEKSENAAFFRWLDFWLAERAALLMRVLSVDSETATAMAAVDLIGWQFNVDRKSTFERCKKAQELLAERDADRRLQKTVERDRN